MSLKPGQTATIVRTFTQTDFDRFAALSGDDNPIHVDSAFAAGSRFGRTVAHGMLLYSTICGVLGTRLPGPGTVQRSQSLMFPAPTFTGEPMKVRVEVVSVAAETAVLATTITRPDGEITCQGETAVWLPGSPVQFPSAAPEEGQPSEESAYKGLRLGEAAVLQRTFTTADLVEYADLTGDANPVHQAGVASTPILPGGLLGGLFSTILGTQLPGRGTNWLKQSFHFLAPVRAGQAIIATVTVSRLRPEKQLVNLSTIATNQTGESICTGQALVWVGDLESSKPSGAEGGE